MRDFRLHKEPPTKSPCLLTMPSELGFGKKKMNIRATILIGSLFVLSAMSMAAESAHLYIKTLGQGEIAGASTQKSKEKWIELQSWSMARESGSGLATGRERPQSIPGVQSSGQREVGTGMASGKRVHSDITISKYSDKASALLMKALYANDTVVECKIAITGADGKTRIGTMNGVWFDSMSVTRSLDGQPPIEELSFTYAKITWTYTEK